MADEDPWCGQDGEEGSASEPTDEDHLPVEEQSLVYRLLKRAWIRRHAKNRKSVQEGRTDLLSSLLEEAAARISLYETLEEEVEELFSNRGHELHDADECRPNDPQYMYPDFDDFAVCNCAAGTLWKALKALNGED